MKDLKEQIEESNRLIAELICIKKEKTTPDIKYPYRYQLPVGVFCVLDKEWYYVQWLEFHSSLDWLTPVITKYFLKYEIEYVNMENVKPYYIFRGIHETPNDFNKTTWISTNGGSVIDAMYKGIMEYIKWKKENL